MPDLTPAPPVVPALQRWTATEGTFRLPARLRWRLDLPDATAAVHGNARTVAERTIAELATLAGRNAERTDDEEADVLLRVDPQLVIHGTDSSEASRTRIDKHGIEVVARSAPGLARAMTSLSQAMRAGELRCSTTEDWPDYPVRGFLLDVARRFVPLPFLHELIGYLGWHKLNTLVIHLNDNEIAKDTGRSWAEAQHAFRLASDNPRFASLAATDGSYTRADWAALEDTAAAHGVTLVPEIDAPAHSRSFIVHDPSLGLNDGDSDMLDLERPQTIDFIQDVFTEFLPWFRGPWVHFGADEYDQKLPAPFRNYFNTMAAFLREHGKRPMAWGSLSTMAGTEERAAGYDRDVTICSWSNEWYGPQEAVADGYDIINMSDTYLYLVPFAIYYHGRHLDGPALWSEWEPHVFADGQSLTPHHPQLLGAMSALWNDLVLLDYDEQTMLEMIEPTFALLGQKMWSGTLPGVDHDGFMAQVAALPDRPRVTRG